MIKYIVKRILVGILTLFILATITFFGVHYMPGNPFEQDNKRMTQAQYDSLNAKFGLDQPLGTQYVMFLKSAVKGDFGESIFKKGRQVSEIIKTEFVPTAKLGAVAFVVAIVVGMTLGIVGALTKRKWLNSIITFIASIGVSIPSFLFAMIMMVLFGVTWKILPVSGLDKRIGAEQPFNGNTPYETVSA